MGVSGILRFMARPNLSYLKNVILFLVGLPCGALTGLTGAGNSVASAPLLGYLVALRGARRAGTALAVTFFAALGALLSYAQHGLIHWGLGVTLAVGQVVGAVQGQRLLDRAPSLARGRLLWATLVVGAGLAMAAHALGVAGWKGLPSPLLPDRGLLGVVAVFGLALVVGAASRVIELGGVLLVPAAIYGLGLSPHAAQGTALVVLLLAALPGMLIHARRGDVAPQPAAWVSLGALFGALMGASYANSPALSDQRLLLIYGVVLTLAGLAMLWRRDREDRTDAPT